MKQLRKAIRNILLENKSHYEKLAKLLTGSQSNQRPQIEAVRQAVELGETLGYLTVKEHFMAPAGTLGYYDLILDPEFFTVALPHLSAMKERIDVNIIQSQSRVIFIITTDEGVK